MKIEGEWEGYYQFGFGYTLPQFGEKVQFKAKFTGSNDDFIGTSLPMKSEFSVDLEASIRGYIEDTHISFVKTYPKKPVFKEPGSSEISIEEGEIDIEYEGFIDEKNESIYGRWALIEFVKDEFGEFEYIFEGLWLIKKIKQ